MTEGEAHTWLKTQLTGPTNGAQAKVLATRLAGPLARMMNGHTTIDPFGWNARIENYEFETSFPCSLFVSPDGRLVGTWIMGNDYRVKSQFYGGYPNTYLPRVRALFRDKTRVLHLFSGMVDTEAFPGDTVDINPKLNPTYLDDGQKLEKVPLVNYDLVLCDPPYSVEDAEHYQTSMIKRNSVMRALARLTKGAYVVWLDQVLPMWRKDTFDLIGIVGIVRSTNHRFRVMSVYRRK